MKKKLVTLLLAGVLAISATACGGSEEPATEETTADSAEEAEAEEEVTYQSILDDYTKQIQDATPGLVEEYNTESAEISNDLNALAELSNSKIEELADISNAGIEEMAELMTKNGDEYDTYEEWAGKLQDVYSDYASQITDAYTSSASGMSTEDIMNSLDSLQQQ